MRQIEKGNLVVGSDGGVVVPSQTFEMEKNCVHTASRDLSITRDYNFLIVREASC